MKQSKSSNSQGHDKLNIRHLKHIDPLGLAFLTSMMKTALNTNIIPHLWKLANIVPIPKPTKDINKGTSYCPISLLLVIAKTLEKSILPYITANIPSTPTQHFTVTALHTLNNTPPPARTITVALNMSKAFDIISIHTLIRKLLQTKIPDTIIEFIANYIKCRTAYTHPHNVNSKLAFHNVASFHQHYLTFTLQTYYHPEHRFRSWSTQMKSPSHLHTRAVQECSKEIHRTISTFKKFMDKTKSHTKSRQNNLHSRPCRI